MLSTNGINIEPIELRIKLNNLIDGAIVPSADVNLYNLFTGQNITEKSPSILYKNGQFMMTLNEAMQLVSIDGYYKRVSCDANGNYSFDPRTNSHYLISQQSLNFNIKNAPTWTTLKIAWWKTLGGDSYIHNFKLSWITAYKSIIKEAATCYNIPAFLLAGVAYIEVAGDPMWIDDVAYNIRSTLNQRENAMKTSFGYVSMQVRRAAETFGYDMDKLGGQNINDLITSLKNPVQNLFMAAAHLAYLRDIDYKGVNANSMTDQQISITAERYNRGPDIKIDRIYDYPNGYGARILANKSVIMEALK